MTQPPPPSSKAGQAAQLLWQSWQNHSRLNELPADLIPQNLDEAYAIQNTVTSLLGRPTVGYKIGLTNSAIWPDAGVTEPIVGRVFPDTVLTNGVVVPPSISQMRAVESEIAFTMGTTFSPRQTPYTLDEVIAGIGSATACIEICDSRFANCDDISLMCIVADNANAAALVLGKQLNSWKAEDFDAMPVTLHCNGAVAAEGSTRKVLGNPLNALLWLVNWLSARNIPLHAGQIVSTGTCTGVTPGAAGDHFQARFGNVADVEFTFGK